METSFIIRKAEIADLSFLVDTIIEAEKSGSDRFSYTTIFGLNEDEARQYISDMLLEEVDGCELSVSSFYVAEYDNKIVAAISIWIEGNEGLPSSVIKGNLLNFTLPKSCFEKANSLNYLLRDLHFENIDNTIQLGLVYVSKEFRGKKLVGKLTERAYSDLLTVNPLANKVYVQVFGNNIPAINSYEKELFIVDQIKECKNSNILEFLPSNKKILMKRILD